MRKFTLMLLLASVLTLTVSAQQIHSDTFSSEFGDRYILHTIEYVDPGKEVVWDLSEVNILSSNAIEIKDPSETPYHTSFDNADLAYDLGNGEFLYYESSVRAYAEYGGVSRGKIVAHSDPKDLLRFSADQKDYFRDSYQSSFSIKGIDFQRSAVLEWRMLGEGTAIFPFGIMDGVNKIKVIENIQDSYEVLGETAVIKSSKESYYFLKPGLNDFVMTLHIESQEGEEQRRYGTLLDSEKLQNMLALYAPVRAIHPRVDSSTANLNVKLISEWTGQMRISLQDLKGKNVIQPLQIAVTPGNVRAEIDWSDLSSGTYVMSLELDDRLSLLKVEKE